ncbi:MAG: ATP-binding cassette domain-containing protein [Planctomycetes bacterium]|nr:ATP-binding cassette domain-containing protein [Planctomycetota bacterium]
MIEITNLRAERDGKPICSVDQLSVAAGERIAVLGANGSGKTTLLRILAGLTSDFTGACCVAVDCKQRTYMHQQPFLFRGSVLANVRYGQRNGGQRNGAGQGSGAKNWLDRLQVGHLAERTTTDLSGGERRRVALARALAMRPQLLLLDEPLADLDDESSAIVCKTLSELADTTLVIASPIALPEGLVDKDYVLS